jgi:hypothetical protein|tara:strand:+ start:498 stop:794 length:297 start_codon:yes stop_codon:yes gene_type:complete
MREKLDDKIKALDSTRVFKKITPKYDLSWYIKWNASFVILIGMALTSAELTPYNLYFHLVGVIGWGAVGYLWHDRALIFINAIATFIFLTGILNYHVA